MCRSDIMRLHQLGDLSIFETTIEAGLSSLKTHHCFYDNLRSDACPVCSEQLNAIAEKLPFSHCCQVIFYHIQKGEFSFLSAFCRPPGDEIRVISNNEMSGSCLNGGQFVNGQREFAVLCK